MNKKKAILLAIEALEYQATEIYEGSEYDDPDVEDFVNSQNQASEALQTLLDELEKLRNVAIEADIFYDAEAYRFEDSEFNPLTDLVAALNEVDL